MVKVVWSDSAVADLESIVEYIAQGSEHYAAAFAEKVLKVVEKLALFQELAGWSLNTTGKISANSFFRTTGSSTKWTRTGSPSLRSSMPAGIWCAGIRLKRGSSFKRHYNQRDSIKRR